MYVYTHTHIYIYIYVYINIYINIKHHDYVPQRTTFIKIWQNKVINTEIALIHQLKEKNKTIFSELHKEICKHITNSLDNFLENSNTRDIAQFFVKEERNI